MGKDLSRRMVKDSLGQTIERVQQDIDSIKKGKKRPDSIDQLTSNLGVMEYGEFRVGNGSAPGTGFTGVRMLYPGVTYNGEVYNLAGVNDDVLQWGGRVSDGVFVAGGGDVVLDDLGLTLLTGELNVNSLKWVDSSGNLYYQQFSHLSGVDDARSVVYINKNGTQPNGLWDHYTYNDNDDYFQVTTNVRDTPFFTHNWIWKTAGGTKSILFANPSETVFNFGGDDRDFRVAGDTATHLFVADAGLDAVQIGTTTAGVIMDARAASVVFNEDGADRDFRVESDTRTHAIFVQGSDGFVGFNEATPRCEVDVNGVIAVNRQDATISGGAITATSNWIQLTAQSGTADDLDTINGMIPGASYTLQAAAGHVITVTDGSGINLAGAVSFGISGGLDKLVVFARLASLADETTRSNN